MEYPLLNPLLETFAAVAACGSFTQAAKRLFLSPTAVMKQMDALEAQLELTLLERTPHGVRLTPAGETVARGAAFLGDCARRTLREARAAAGAQAGVFRVGTSLLNPARPFMELWYRLSGEFPDATLRLVPFEDDSRGIVSEIERLGEKFDFLVGVCDSKIWLEHCRMLPLGTFQKQIAVRRDHRFAGKERLSLPDLYGETLMMVKAGDSAVNDAIRSDLAANHPQIRIEDTPQFYDVSVFNRCAETGNLLLTLDCWKDVHPALVNVPVSWDYSIPYGLLYAPEPDAHAARFVRAAARLLEADRRGGETS